MPALGSTWRRLLLIRASWTRQVLLYLLRLVQHGVRVSVRLLRPCVGRLAWMFCVTMMMGKSTNWKNVWAIHETITRDRPLLTALGRLTSAPAVNR